MRATWIVGNRPGRDVAPWLESDMRLLGVGLDPVVTLADFVQWIWRVKNWQITMSVDVSYSHAGIAFTESFGFAGGGYRTAENEWEIPAYGGQIYATDEQLGANGILYGRMSAAIGERHWYDPVTGLFQPRVNLGCEVYFPGFGDGVQINARVTASPSAGTASIQAKYQLDDGTVLTRAYSMELQITPFGSSNLLYDHSTITAGGAMIPMEYFEYAAGGTPMLDAMTGFPLPGASVTAPPTLDPLPVFVPAISPFPVE